jgi:dihydroorotase-like cyclic amidohydrolase
VAIVEAARLIAFEVLGQTSVEAAGLTSEQTIVVAHLLVVNCDVAHHPRNSESPPLKESEREATLGPPLQSGPVQLVPTLHGLQTRATSPCHHL